MSTVKVGVMPGRVNEFVVEESTTIAQLLVIAEVSAEGYEVKVDGNKVTDFNAPVGTASLVLLTKQVKGNALVKVGVMPGRVNEFYVEDGASVAQILEIAEVSADGYEVKVDGNKVTDFNTTAGTAGLILLTKQVKGNALVKVGVMPGRVNEFVVEDSATVAEILTIADVSADGYEVKVDGNKVTDFNTTAGTAGLILLTKQVKGNNRREDDRRSPDPIIIVDGGGSYDRM